MFVIGTAPGRGFSRRHFVGSAAACSVAAGAAPARGFGMTEAREDPNRSASDRLLGWRRVGSGPVKAIVMNDWIDDTSTWDACQPFLDATAVEWIFADLRGYGLSRQLHGPHGAVQAGKDILELADSLDVPRLVIVGHSMSSVVARHLAQSEPERITGAVLITPPPLVGSVPDEVVEGAKAIARSDDAGRKTALRQMWGDRLSDAWIDFKVARWRAAADPEAVADYVDMFARTGLPSDNSPAISPVVAITGEVDPNPMMRSAAVRDALHSLSPGAKIVPIADSGHYPMQEVPPLFATIVSQLVRDLGRPQ